MSRLAEDMAILAAHAGTTAPKPQAYVAGLLFDDHGELVALVRKNRPAWQAGRLNAIGGKIEPGETPAEAMRREFREETGVEVAEWWPVAILRGPGFVVHFFAKRDTDALFACRSTTDERIERHRVADALAHPATLPNLRVVAALALDDSGIVKPVNLQDARAAA